MSNDKPKESELVCAHCGATKGVFENGVPMYTTDEVLLVPYWCNTCMLPFHIYKKNGKVVKRGEF